MDLVRLILLELDNRGPINPKMGLDIEGYDFHTTQVHLKILIE